MLNISYLELYYALSYIVRTVIELQLLLTGILGALYYYMIGRALLLYIQYLMEKLNYNNFFKNIPTPTNTSYQLALIEKI